MANRNSCRSFSVCKCDDLHTLTGSIDLLAKALQGIRHLSFFRAPHNQPGPEHLLAMSRTHETLCIDAVAHLTIYKLCSTHIYASPQCAVDVSNTGVLTQCRIHPSVQCTTRTRTSQVWIRTFILNNAWPLLLYQNQVAYSNSLCLVSSHYSFGVSKLASMRAKFSAATSQFHRVALIRHLRRKHSILPRTSSKLNYLQYYQSVTAY
jgi:hypothetical protein